MNAYNLRMTEISLGEQALTGDVAAYHDLVEVIGRQSTEGMLSRSDALVASEMLGELAWSIGGNDERYLLADIALRRWEYEHDLGRDIVAEEFLRNARDHLTALARDGWQGAAARLADLPEPSRASEHMLLGPDMRDVLRPLFAFAAQGDMRSLIALAQYVGRVGDDSAENGAESYYAAEVILRLAALRSALDAVPLIVGFLLKRADALSGNGLSDEAVEVAAQAIDLLPVLADANALGVIATAIPQLSTVYDGRPWRLATQRNAALLALIVPDGSC